jgi:hypothetical protein
LRLVVVWLTLLASACGGVVSGGGDGGVDGGDASPQWSPVCPEMEPSQGSSCSQEGINCEYACSDVVVCSDGTWAGAVNAGQDITCDAGPNPSACPTSLSSIPAGSACTGDGLVCIYAAGLCECTSPGDPTPDAGASWSCGPEPGCPMPRPRIGSACTSPNEKCDYAPCGDSVSCTSGVWQPAFVGCGA